MKLGFVVVLCQVIYLILDGWTLGLDALTPITIPVGSGSKSQFVPHFSTDQICSVGSESWIRALTREIGPCLHDQVNVARTSA